MGGCFSFASSERIYSIADQVARFERAKVEKNNRYLDITSVFNGAYLKGKRVLVVGASKGLGLEIVKEAQKQGADCYATCRKTNPELDAIGCNIIKGIEVTSIESMKKMATQLKTPCDYVIYNAGYFPDIVDNLDAPDLTEAKQQIDVCALGPIRCASALKGANMLKGTKFVIISSQAGSAAWRSTQNAGKGTDYGHHMSRAACNIGGVLMCEELRSAGVPVVMLHPGFNRTTMTAKYSAIWDREGAVESHEGAKRVLFEVEKVSMAKTGQFINCEDGLQIPF